MAVRMLLKPLLLIAAAVLLSACALPRMIDSDVQSFTGTTAPKSGASYRFERLPSQSSRGTDHVKMEALAEAALSRAGLKRNEARADMSVQVGVQVIAMHSPIQRSPRHRSPVVELVMESPWYSHTVNFVMRDIATGQVSYETTASFDGPWSDSLNLLPAIMDAALNGYPTPPAGLRRVVVELPAPIRSER